MADEFQDVLDEFLFDLANDILFEDIKTLENVSEACEEKDCRRFQMNNKVITCVLKRLSRIST